jgi:hypothetical protein
MFYICIWPILRAKPFHLYFTNIFSYEWSLNKNKTWNTNTIIIFHTPIFNDVSYRILHGLFPSMMFHISLYVFIAVINLMETTFPVVIWKRKNSTRYYKCDVYITLFLNFSFLNIFQFKHKIKFNRLQQLNL